MATLLQIYTLEPNISAAWKTLLTAGLGSSVQVRVPVVDDPAQTSELKVPRVEVTVSNNGAGEHIATEAQLITGTLRYHGQWNLGVNLRVITDRTQANGSAHSLIRAQCRIVGGTKTQAEWNGAFTGEAYEVLSIKEAPSVYMNSDEDSLDITELNFDMVVRVLRDAWPTS
jgi:hypothetical protein